MKKIETKFFNEIEVEDNSIINFADGIPGFEDYKLFTIIDINKKGTLKCLQSMDCRDICLIIISPWDYFYDYEIELMDEELKALEIEKQEDIVVFNVISIRNDKITANLAAPIIINTLKMKGRQIILSNTKYEIRQEIKCS